MKTERRDVKFPMWRKKVDASFLRDGETPIPGWVADQWRIESFFSQVTSKKDERSKIEVIFGSDHFCGNIVKKKRKSGYRYRMYCDTDLAWRLRETFLMSYMRSLEGELRKAYGGKSDVEADISFWEFLDIECDAGNGIVYLKAHYKQESDFNCLFGRLVKSSPLKVVQDEIERKDLARIYKEGWKARGEYKRELGAENVIYTLLDTKNRLIYVGEAAKLKQRFDRGHSDIAEWDYYKYNALPAQLEKHRVTIERMAIRDLAALLENKQEIESKLISSYKLANRKIDR